MPASLERALALFGADRDGDGVEHAVHERRRLVAAEPLGDLDGFVDRHARGHVAPAEKLVGRDAQDVAIDVRESLHAPVVGALRDQLVDAGALVEHPADEILTERPSVRRRIALLALSLALAVGSQFSLIILLPLTLIFMWWVAPARRGAAFAIWAVAVVLATLQLWAAYGFHSLAMWQGLRNANLFAFSGQAFVNSGVYRQVVAVIAKSSPALMIALPASLAIYIGWGRSRYFGNTAPLLVAVLFLVLGMANPHFPGAGFYLVAVVFLFVFVAGIAVDLLETRHRPVVLASVIGLLSASAFWNILQLLRM